MDQPDPSDVFRAPSLKASLLMLAFGLFVLAFLVAIDRPHWFTLRPASGTAAAMWHAADAPAPARP